MLEKLVRIGKSGEGKNSALKRGRGSLRRRTEKKVPYCSWLAEGELQNFLENFSFPAHKV